MRRNSKKDFKIEHRKAIECCCSIENLCKNALAMGNEGMVATVNRPQANQHDDVNLHSKQSF